MRSAAEAENWSRWTFTENPKGVRAPGWKYPVLEPAISYQTSNCCDDWLPRTTKGYTLGQNTGCQVLGSGSVWTVV